MIGSCRIPAGAVLAALIVAGGLWGCPIPYDPRIVSIETVEPSYDAGDTVVVRLVNIGDDDLTYWPCGTFLEQKMLTPRLHWIQRSAAMVEAPCLGILVPLGAGQSDSVTYLLPGDTPSGIYRYRFDDLYRDGVLLPVGDRSSHSFGVRLP